MRKSLFALPIVLALVSSCTSIRQTSTTTSVETKVSSFTVADVEVSPQKVIKTYSWSFNPFKKTSINTIKSNVTAELLNNANADVLVEPQYIIEERGLFRGGSVTVIGFPATYKNFHKMTPEESVIFNNVMSVHKKQSQKKFFFF